jgi:hypothetical protein
MDIAKNTVYPKFNELMTNYDAANVLVETDRPGLVQHLRRAYAALYTENFDEGRSLTYTDQLKRRRRNKVGKLEAGLGDTVFIISSARSSFW